MIRTLLVVACAMATSLGLIAADISKIGAGNRTQIQGKETDWIDGDYLLQSDTIIAVIAHPTPTRDANMTVRGVGAGIIDLTRRDIASDQLSAFYPAGGRYSFTDDTPTSFTTKPGGKEVVLTLQSTKAVAGDGTQCQVQYRLRDGEPFIRCAIVISGGKANKLRPYDSVRADRTFKFSTLGDTSVAYCQDEYFRQTYGFTVSGKSTPKWDKGRARRLSYSTGDAKTTEASVAWETKIYPASSALDLLGLTGGGTATTFQVNGAKGQQPRIKLAILEGDVAPLTSPVWRSAPDGKSIVHLKPGKYRVEVSAVGHQPFAKEIVVGSQPNTVEMQLGPATLVKGKVVDGNGNPIPCKVSFYGREIDGKETTAPDFGLDSQDGSVGNTLYTANGEFTRSIPPGNYEAVISYGPEYDASFQDIVVKPNSTTELRATLKHVVDTTGWVSAELHSHSSPSGDNTSSQLGRVENLVCEHLEFAPCTEHQRVESYDDQLEILNATDKMATCTGMELTGSLLPINHQNAFPIKWEPHAQDGGGPRVSGNPVTQIARLAMWDDNSSKVVQTNHPNLRQMLRDRNLDGKEDGGYSKMLDYMDVMEIHPPQDIFTPLTDIDEQKKRDRNRMQPWMDLIKSGRYIPGVVNTDAHYNWHGSGWLRNWIRSTTDVPAEIKIGDMIKGLEKGRVIMSTGPFMTFRINHADLEQPADIGDHIVVSGGTVEAAIQIQCPNWLDVNRVEVFVNGKLDPKLTRRRSSHADAFGDGVIKFDQRLELNLSGDNFIIAAAIGEKLELGRVMGKMGTRPPVVVSNPIFVKVK